jgi:CRISPR/Cas system CMR-associated protein Cmr1 (group 7 of RAMP superfamily)
MKGKEEQKKMEHKELTAIKKSDLKKTKRKRNKKKTKKRLKFLKKLSRISVWTRNMKILLLQLLHNHGGIGLYHLI